MVRDVKRPQGPATVFGTCHTARNNQVKSKMPSHPCHACRHMSCTFMNTAVTHILYW